METDSKSCCISDELLSTLIQLVPILGHESLELLLSTFKPILN